MEQNWKEQKAYQESRKEVLEVDGICGSATWKDLIAI